MMQKSDQNMGIILRSEVRSSTSVCRRKLLFKMRREKGRLIVVWGTGTLGMWGFRIPMMASLLPDSEILCSGAMPAPSLLTADLQIKKYSLCPLYRNRMLESAFVNVLGPLL